MKIILATSNIGKAKEFKELLAGHEIIPYSDVLEPFEIEENEDTFAKNALIKANAVYDAILGLFNENKAQKPMLIECKKALQEGCLCVLSDDSGISVEALNFAPGIYSARYSSDVCAQPNAASNRAKMIDELNKRGLESSRAFYTAALALVYGIKEHYAKFKGIQSKMCYVTHGFLHGRVITRERGENGFGYDFMFIPDGYENTIGELGADIKASISHRSRAANVLMPILNMLQRQANTF